MKLTAWIAAAMALSSLGHASANEGAMCAAVGRTQLNDSSQQRLDDLYCGASFYAKINKDLTSLSQRRIEQKIAEGMASSEDQQDAIARAAALVQCVKTTESIRLALEKRFKAKTPSRCPLDMS